KPLGREAQGSPRGGCRVRSLVYPSSCCTDDECTRLGGAAPRPPRRRRSCSRRRDPRAAPARGSLSRTPPTRAARAAPRSLLASPRAIRPSPGRARAGARARRGRPPRVIELFPDSAEVRGGELWLGGVPASRLADEHGTPLLVYCGRTLRARAEEIRRAAPDAVVAFGSKAFPNVAVLRVLAEAGIGADVASPGELAFARAAGLTGPRLVVHGNNKPDELLREAARAQAVVVLDGEDEAARAAAAGVRSVL